MLLSKRRLLDGSEEAGYRQKRQIVPSQYNVACHQVFGDILDTLLPSSRLGITQTE
jgi:hypothetical protein